MSASKTATARTFPNAVKLGWPASALKPINNNGATFDLSADTVVKSYQIDHALRAEQQGILTDPSTTSEQKLQMISKIRQETENAMKDVLGEQAFKAYRPPPTLIHKWRISSGLQPRSDMATLPSSWPTGS